MEAVPGALFRMLPSREGALPHHVQGRDAFIELDYSMGGARYRSLIKADGQTGSQEAHLFNHDGTTPLVSGKVKEYDAAIAERIGTPDLFLASVFQSQTRKGNFLDLGKADRKALMIRMLGLEQLQVFSDKAGERAKALEQEITVARARLTDLDGQLAALDDLRHNLSIDEGKLQEAQQAVETARAELQKLVEEEARIKASLGRATELRRDLYDLSQEITSLETKRADLLGRLVNNRKLVGQAAEVRAAVTMLQTLEKELTAKRDAIVQADQERETLLEEQQKAQALTLQAADLDRRVTELLRDAGDAKTAKLGKLDSEIRLTEQALAKERQVVATLTAKAESHARESVSLRERSKVLQEIPCGDSFPTCSLIAQAITACDGIAQADEAAREAQQEAAAASERCMALEEKVAELETQRTDIAAAPVEEPAEVAELRAQVAQLRVKAQGPEAGSALLTIKSAIAKLQAEAQGIEARITETRKTADLLARLETAETRIAELEAEVAQIDQERTAKAAKVAELETELATTPGQLHLSAAAAARVAAEQTLKTREEEVGYHQGRVAAGKARITDLEALQPERDDLADRLDDLFTHVADWKHLQRAFGKDGIQALEIDAAGPEVSALINDLLLSCFGPRFTLSFETTAAKADGKGEKEVFDIRIIDNERGREGKLETLSGGEKVILNEAISLALAIYNARKSGQRFETLFRDETAGALDPQNAERYMQMLRRALELGGFHQLVFIAHSQDLWEQADARVFVKGGKVLVDSPTGFVQAPGQLAEVA
ncbi:chromosome segregation protein [compost metagenome]